MKISNNAAKAAVNAVTALIDNGSTLVLYSGTQPTDADTALSGNTVLATFSLAATAFAAAVDGNPNAIATANAIANVNAVTTGTASFFRILNSTGVCVFQGSAGTSGTDAILSTTSITSGIAVAITSLTLTMPE